VITIFISETAREQIAEVEAWWVENRPAAPDLFTDELAAALALLSEAPRSGVPYLHPRATGIRRLLLFRCRYHLYYSVDRANQGDGEQVTIVALWHAQRGSGPVLK
jgi:plasmid stabilization system protein ParE